MIRKYTLDPVKFILTDLFEQSWVMWLFIGWGWLSMLVMVTSFVSQLLQL